MAAVNEEPRRVWEKLESIYPAYQSVIKQKEMTNFKFKKFDRKSVKHGKYVGISIWKSITVSTEMKHKLRQYKSVDIYYDSETQALQLVCFEDKKVGTFTLGWMITTDLDGKMPKGRYHWQPEEPSAPNVFIFKLHNP